MKSKFVKLSKKPLVRNVMIVASGTAAAQAITMAFAPIITRLYGPEAYGVQGVFMGIVGIITPIAALTYPIAIVLPKSDTDAKSLARLSIYIAGVIAVFVALVLVFFNKQLVRLLKIEAIAPFLYLIPLVILFSAFLQVANQWLIRTKQYGITAKVAFLQVIIMSSAKAGIGWFKPSAAVLIILATLGSALQAIMLVIGASRSQYKQVAEINMPTTIKELAGRHKDFPLYRAPQVFINAISQNLPVFLLASFFGPSSVGFYTIGRTVLGIPAQLIGKSVVDVFYPRIVEAANNNENITQLIKKATLVLAVTGIMPFGIVVAFGPWIFGFVFGSEWVIAGEYARWLAIWLFFGFLNFPSVAAIPVLNLQGSLLIYEVFSTLSKVVVLVIGFYLFKNAVIVIALFSLAGAVAYVYLILWVIKSSQTYKVSLKR